MREQPRRSSPSAPRSTLKRRWSGRSGRRLTVALALLAALGCSSSSSRERLEQAYALRWAVDVYERPDHVKSCERVATLNFASLPCTNLLPGVSMGGTECARFWTVDRGGDTLLVKRGNVGDVYLCRAPLLAPESLVAAKGLPRGKEPS